MKPALIGLRKVAISHLQYADDVVFLCSQEKENRIALKRILKLIELMSGLKVNFGKCKLIGVNVMEEQITEAAEFLGCGVDKNSFTYLGMKIGINPHRRNAWSWLMQKVRNRIASWDGRFISMGGRATLVQSVLA